jgi:hypothetical protein
MKYATRTLTVFLLSSLVLLSACDLTRFAANSTSKVFGEAAPALERFFDYEIAMSAAPGQIAQLEGMLRIVPDNRIYIMTAIRAYCAYAYGSAEDAADQYEVEGDYEASELNRDRAKLLYLRARDLGFHYMSLDHEGREEAMAGGMDTFAAWLEREFVEPEDAAILLWTGYGWGSAINSAKNDLSLVPDIPYAEAMVQRAVALEESVSNYAGVTFLATVQSSSMSGNLERALELWNTALEGTERRYLLIQFNMARSYAVRTQDRALYISLLREVLEAGDIFPEQRLANLIAKRKALRALRLVDELFAPN